MEITEVRIKLMEGSEDRLRAFCSVTFDDCFVVRDLKIIEGTHGPFVAMPSRKLTNRCNRCGMKNNMRSNYCNNCGVKLREYRGGRDDDSPNKLYADVAHPINQECRDQIQNRVVEEYREELERAKVPGYVSRYDDSYESQELKSDKSETTSDSDSDRRVDQPIDASSAVPKPHMNTDSQLQSRRDTNIER